MTCDRKIGPYPCCSVVEGDCLELMRELEDGCVDAVITDPPYGLGSEVWDTNEKTPKRRWRLHHDQMGWDQKTADILPMLGMAKYWIVWGGHLMGLPPKRGWLVWNKIIRNFSSGVCELAWTNLEIPIDAFDYSHGELANEGKVHPTQKPLPLMEWCVNYLPEEADIILDPFCGSGTTLVAAKKLGRHFLGFEISPEYCAISRDRLARIEAQPNLFEAKPEQLKLGN